MNCDYPKNLVVQQPQTGLNQSVKSVYTGKVHGPTVAA